MEYLKIRYLLPTLFPLLFSLFSCEEESVNLIDEQIARDEVIIEDFLARNSITNFQKTSNGLYYITLEEGTGGSPTTADSVVIEFTGRLLDGKKFLTTTLTDQPFSFLVDQSISVTLGIHEGIKLMKTGGVTRFIMPTQLSATGNNSIPSNSIHDFEIELVYFE
ncbi:MAG: FKBP-type peptidyl-prolyl cis-trans isomerase [Bacteroidota bacterium]